MKKITCSIATMLSSLALVSTLYAAPPVEMYQGRTYYQEPELRGYESVPESRAQAEWRSEAHTAEHLLGLPVVAQDGENLGDIRDITLDTRTGRINYVTVQKGGATGMGEEVAVPVEAFRFTDENAILTVDKTKLDNAPRPTDLSGQEFQRDLESHYGVSPAWRD